MTEILKTSEFGSQAGHFYTRDRKLVEDVSSADGKKSIKPDLRHARKLDLAPGVTSIMGMAHKPALVKWQCEQAVMSALTLPRQAGEPDEAFVARCISDSQEQVRKAAERGTSIHAAIERYLKRGEVDTEHAETVQAAANVLRNAFGDVPWSSETVAVSRFGYGTKVDLWHGDNSRLVVLDIKSKDGHTADCRLYDEHPEQLAAGADALNHSWAFPAGTANAPVGGVLFVSRTIPGDVTLVSCDGDSMNKGLRRFLALLRFWQLKRDYRPSWAEDFTV